MKKLTLIISIVLMTIFVNAQTTWTQVSYGSGCNSFIEWTWGATFNQTIENHWVVAGPNTTIGCEAACLSGAGLKSISGFGTIPDPDIYLEYGISTPYLTNFQVDLGDWNTIFYAHTSSGGPNKVLLVAYMVSNNGYNLVDSLIFSASNPNCFSISPQGSIVEIQSEDSLVIRFYPYFDGIYVDPTSWFGISHFGLAGTVGLGILPVSLISFQVQSLVPNGGGNNFGNGQVKIDWSTATELNNDYFLIDHSMDGNYWTTFGRVEGAGNSQEIINYTLIVKGESGTNYYRLRQFDNDGSETIFDTVSIELEEVQNLSGLVGQNIKVNGPVYDVSGRLINNGPTFRPTKSGLYLTQGYKISIR